MAAVDQAHAEAGYVVAVSAPWWLVGLGVVALVALVVWLLLPVDEDWPSVVDEHDDGLHDGPNPG